MSWLPLPRQQISVLHVQVTTVTDEYGDTTKTQESTEIGGCLHAPEYPSEADQRVVVPATLYLPVSRHIAEGDKLIYPDGDVWEVLGGGSDWGMGTSVPLRRWGSRQQGGTTP